MRKAQPVIMEPIMKVVVVVPEEYMGDVIGDLNSRRGQIQGMEASNGVAADQLLSSRCPKCSVTRPTCAPRPRAAATTRWNPATTSRFRRTIAEKIMSARREAKNKFCEIARKTLAFSGSYTGTM